MCECCCSDSQLPLVLHRSMSRNGYNNNNYVSSNACHHHYQNTTTTSSSPACFELDSCNLLVPWTSQTCNNSSKKIEVLLRQLLNCCIEDSYSISQCCETTTCEQVCQHSKCNFCENEQQTVVLELADLLERVQGGGFRCSCERSKRCGIRRCHLSHHETRIESQALMDVFTRIIKRTTHTHSHSHASHMHCSSSRVRRCAGFQLGESHLRRLVSQLLDELECNGRAICEYQNCYEYLEVNSRRLKRELRQVDVECTGRKERCVCAFGATGGGGCSSGCCETMVKTVVRGPAPRKQRSGNIHVGWNL